jgi:hypothetical protein
MDSKNLLSHGFQKFGIQEAFKKAQLKNIWISKIWIA